MKRVLICIYFLGLVACNNDSSNQSLVKKPQYELSGSLNNLTKLVQLYPDSIILIEQYIDTLEQMEEYQKAIFQNDRLIKKDSFNHDLWYKKALFSERLSDTLSAIKFYRFSLQCFATPQAMLSLAHLLAEQKKREALLVCKNIGIRFSASEFKADTYFIEGVFYARIGNTQAALTSFNSCINKRYSYLEAYMEKGFILFEQAKIEEAFSIFEATIKLNPTYADGYYWMAKCKQKLNQHSEALHYYQKALTFDPSIKEAAEAIKQIQ